MVEGGTVGVAGERWLAPTLHVALTTAGPVIPAMDEHPAIPLVPAALAVLELMAGVEGRDARAFEELASRHGAGPTDLEGFLAALDQRGLLTTVPPGPGHAAGTRPGTQDAAPVEALDFTADGTSLVMGATWILRPVPGGFAAFDHDGVVSCVLRATDLVVANVFRLPSTRPDDADL